MRREGLLSDKGPELGEKGDNLILSVSLKKCGKEGKGSKAAAADIVTCLAGPSTWKEPPLV